MLGSFEAEVLEAIEVELGPPYKEAGAFRWQAGNTALSVELKPNRRAYVVCINLEDPAEPWISEERFLSWDDFATPIEAGKLILELAGIAE